MNQPMLEISNRTLIDRRRPHLIDVYLQTAPGCLERVATYSTKTRRLTFYDFPANYAQLWEGIDFFKELFPLILKRKESK